MIVLAVCRIGVCEICQAQFYLEAEEVPDKCPVCGTRVWLYGIESRIGRFIRQELVYADKVMNPGVASAKSKAWSDKYNSKKPPVNIRRDSKKNAERTKRRKALKALDKEKGDIVGSDETAG